MFPLLLKLCEYLTPLTTLTYLSSKLADAKLGGFTQWLIKTFAQNYNINLQECEIQEFERYKSFNEFFIRKLKADARPICHHENCLAISPVDGTVGQADSIKAGRLIQAKGLDYSLSALLGGNVDDVTPFVGGNFACIYLSPANYHRIHMPLDGKLLKTIHIPGRHFPVGRRNVAYMDDLFTKNERLVCIFDSKIGPFALVMVGAAFVGSIATVWDGTIVRRSGIQVKDYKNQSLVYVRGDEIGHFKFGSTVICVWPQNSGAINYNICSGNQVKMGEPMIGNVDPATLLKSTINQNTEHNIDKGHHP